ncbi:hypothetical protein CASFOL_036011 [Castilleja foliolosa]|uniref:PUM-HD domain-containing protein n=1 Tax=Castilleja foliolosa TaxID=1961234 RepID=A0ABD3BVH0_9LAMI
MEGQGRRHSINDSLNSSSRPYFSMASENTHPNRYFPSINHRPTDPGYIPAAYNHRPTNSTYIPSAANHLPTNSSYIPAAANHLPTLPGHFAANNHHQSGTINSYYSAPLESQFNRMNISTPENRIRAPSTNTGLGFSYMDHDNNLNNLYNLYMNQPVSRYAYNYGMNNNQNLDMRYRSDYNNIGVIGPRNSNPSFNSRPVFTNGLGSQFGSRFSQKKFEEFNPEDINLKFSWMKNNICDLMVDHSGNYLVQKFFMMCNEEQRNQLLYSLIKDEIKFKDICNDMHGTRAVQKLFEYLTTHEQRARVVSVLRRITLALAKNNNGQHVIQYCLKHFSSEDTKHILGVVADNCLEIANDKSGCCVLQQCLTDSVGESRDRLIAQITSNALDLSTDAYGNYVVQYILGLNDLNVTSDIMKQLSGCYVYLSTNKYASNVVEKILKQSEGDEALPIVEELIHSRDFLMVLQDQFGNYVAQSALNASRGPVHEEMCRLINANYPFLHSHPYGKRVLARAKRFKLRL